MQRRSFLITTATIGMTGVISACSDKPKPGPSPSIAPMPTPGSIPRPSPPNDSTAPSSFSDLSLCPESMVYVRGLPHYANSTYVAVSEYQKCRLPSSAAHARSSLIYMVQQHGPLSLTINDIGILWPLIFQQVQHRSQKPATPQRLPPHLPARISMFLLVLRFLTSPTPILSSVFTTTVTLQRTLYQAPLFALSTSSRSHSLTMPLSHQRVSPTTT